MNKKNEIFNEQFGSNREFLVSGEVRSWVNWPYSRDVFYKALIRESTGVFLFGVFYDDGVECYIEGRDYFLRRESEESKAGINDEFQLSVRDFIKSNFNFFNGHLVPRNFSEDIFDNDIFSASLAGAYRRVTISLLFSFSSRSIDRVLELVRHHSTINFEGGISQSGNWRSRDAFARKIAKTGDIALVVEGGNCRVFYPAELYRNVFDLKNFFEENGRSHREAIESGIYINEMLRAISRK